MNLILNPKIDVLILEHRSTPNRDTNMMAIMYGELKYNRNLNVKAGSRYFWRCLVLLHRPAIVLIASSTGAFILNEISKYCSALGVKVICCVSEGHFIDKPGVLDQFIWGWNKEKKLYVHKQLFWTKKSLDLACRYDFKFREIGEVTGPIHFDLYQRKDESEQRDLETITTVGIAGWTFGKFSNPSDRDYDLRMKLFGRESCERTRLDGIQFNEIILQLCLAYPSVKFLFKDHPSNHYGLEGAGVVGLDAFDNFHFIQGDLELHELIAKCDVWLSYESTTNVEAWHSGIPTIVVNPSGRVNERSSLHRGSLVVENFDELRVFIDDSKSLLQSFNHENLAFERNEVIAEIQDSVDGKSRLRAADAVCIASNECQSESQKLIFSFTYLEKTLRETVYWFMVIPLSKFSSRFKLLEKEKRVWRLKEFISLSIKYHEELNEVKFEK